MSKKFGARTAYGLEVVLNVYDLSPLNSMLHPIGLGIYHSGVEVNGMEYTFAAGGGIFHHDPKKPPQETTDSTLVLRDSIKLGVFEDGIQGLQVVLDRLRSTGLFAGDKYNLVSRNCNSFSRVFSLALIGKKVETTFPGYVNRLANIGSYIPCLNKNHEEVHESSLAKQERQTFIGTGTKLSGAMNGDKNNVREARLRRLGKIKN